MRKDSLCTDEDCESIIRKYSEMVYRLAFSMLKSKADADDIHQEVFVRYLRRCPEFESEVHEKAWFLRVTVNCCKNYWKTAWFRKRAEWKEPGPDAAETVNEEQQELIETVKSLPWKYRAVIHLYYYEELPVEEISRLMNAKPSTVRTQLTRARAMLRKKLKEEI